MSCFNHSFHSPNSSQIFSSSPPTQVHFLPQKKKDEIKKNQVSQKIPDPNKVHTKSMICVGPLLLGMRPALEYGCYHAYCCFFGEN